MDGISTPNDVFRSRDAIDACFSHARDLLRAGRRVLGEEKLPGISFHLATLALEEIGKASLIGSRDVARAYDSDTTFIDNRLGDHIFKLFWALWTPSFGRKAPSREEFEQLRGLARQIHDDRLAALYVSAEDTDAPPIQQVGEERARWLLSLAEARLGIEGTRDWDTMDFSTAGDIRWFIGATGDPETRKMIFGSASHEKLAEVGDIRTWMAWLRGEFEKAEAEANQHLKAELARTVPGHEQPGEEKWRIRVRYHSPALSIRGGVLKTWNQQPTWIKLLTVDKQKNQLDVEFTIRENVSLQALGPMSAHITRLFLASLNIATLGLWWWRPTDHYARMYEKVTDLKAAGTTAQIELNIQGAPRFDWSPRALNERDIRRIGLLFGALTRITAQQRGEILEPYLAGLGLLAKSDMYLNMAVNACERFAVALLAILRHYRGWDGDDATLPAVIAFAIPLMPAEDQTELLDLLNRFRHFPPKFGGLTIESAAILKTMVDTCLILVMEERAKVQGWGTDADAERVTDLQQ
jgi:AbiV family abortive infection protein